MQHFITCHAITVQQSEKATTITWLKDKTQHKAGDFFNLFLHFLFCNTWTSSHTHACSTTNSLGHPTVWKKGEKSITTDNPCWGYCRPTMLHMVSYYHSLYLQVKFPLFYKKTTFSPHLPPPFCATLCSFMPQLIQHTQKICKLSYWQCVCVCVCVHAFGLILCAGLCALTWRNSTHTREHIILCTY